MLNDNMEESIYYNAVAVAVAGDYGSIAKLKIKFGGWKRAYERLKIAGVAKLDAEEEWKKLERAGVRLILFDEEGFPRLLKEISGPPFGIYLKGTATRDDAPPFAVVGTRRATPEGKSIARRFARELAHAGFPIASGLAFGIDAAAHEGCLDGGGITIAVLAGGLDSIYPRSNEKLAGKILESGGAIISEYPLGSPPYPARFIERNRIISGLSLGTLIIEAPDGSGSLATARFAVEQNRDVFAVPGPIAHPNFFGSHALIRQGAELVTKPEDILEAYGVTPQDKRSAEENAASPEEKLILEALRKISTPAEVDKIIMMTRLEPHIVNRALGFLLVKNLVKEKGAGYTI